MDAADGAAKIEAAKPAGAQDPANPKAAPTGAEILQGVAAQAIEEKPQDGGEPAAEKIEVPEKLTLAEEQRVSAVLAITAEQESAKQQKFHPLDHDHDGKPGGSLPKAQRAHAYHAEPPRTNFIQPTPGRIVWYRKSRDDGIPPAPNDEPLAAIVCGVIDSLTVNIGVLGYDGSGMHTRQNVTLVQDGPCLPGQCTWMPYQRGQAAKTQQLEREQAKG